MAVEKCFIALSVPADDVKVRILCEDIVDVYKYDSIEDIIEALKNGRRGLYGKNYAKLDMIVFSEWMANHLEVKASIREKELSKLKAKNLEIQSAEIDYDAYRKRMANEGKAKRTNNAEENAYQKFRMEYFDSKNKSDECD